MTRFGFVFVVLSVASGCASATSQVEAQLAAKLSSVAVINAGDAAGKSRSATPLHLPSPEYPESERASATEASVVVHYEVDERGIVSDARAEGPAAFRQKALEAMASWRFSPATLNGAPRRSHRVAHFKFRVAT